LLSGLRKELGHDIHQAGSNITAERLRFDFNYHQKVGRDVLDRIEEYVNNIISQGCYVKSEIMSKEDAKTNGVEGSFWEKYPEQVTVYTIIGKNGEVFSRELCGGPHVQSSDDFKGRLKILKEEASSAGVRRIKAILQ
jgi:alanyl-tRNA synthetase